MKLLKKFRFLEDSILLAALIRLIITAELKLSFCMPTAFLIQTIWTQMMPNIERSIIMISPVNFFLFIRHKINS
jgi:hypothetical protein